MRDSKSWLLIAVLFLAWAPMNLYGATPLSPVPGWAKQGRFRFMRFDGGYIEQEKAKRSNWGKTWSEEESNIVGALYSKHLDQAIKLLKEANVNWVWVTWSNGWSHQYETAQWNELRGVVEKLHAAGIRVTAYLCATTMFWERMFLDQPRSVAWLSFSPRNQNLVYGNELVRPAFPYTAEWSPVTYGSRNPLRFIADVSNQEWLDYTKVRVSAAVDAGVDALFFDNPFVGYPQVRDVSGFFEQVQDFVKRVKNSSVLVYTNVGLPPSVVSVNDHCEVLFNEFGVEPGNYSGDWIVGNLRKVRYIKGASGLKPHMYQTGTGSYRSGRREVAFMLPKSQKLAIAEAAALQSNFLNLLEGRFLKGLIRSEPEALASWQAIGQYNKFLLEHENLYLNAEAVPEVLVLASDQWPIRFDWDNDNSWLFDFLSQQSIQYDVLLLSRLTLEILRRYPLVVLPGIEAIPSRQVAMLKDFQRAGGKVYGLGGSLSSKDLSDTYSSVSVLVELGNNPAARSEVTERVNELLKRRIVEVLGANSILALASRIAGTERTVIHLLNYQDSPQNNVSLKLDLSFLSQDPGSSSIRAHSPDSASASLENLKIQGKKVQFTLPRLDTYQVVTVNF